VAAAIILCAGWFVLGWFSTLQREVATAIVAGFVAVMVSIVSVLLSKYFDRKREIEQAQRANKAEIYEDLLKFVFSHAFSAKLPDQVPSEAKGSTSSTASPNASSCGDPMMCCGNTRRGSFL
jgi:hypothetical protein